MDLKKIGPLVLKQNLPNAYTQQAKIALSQMEQLNPNSRKLCLKSCFTKHVDLLNQWLPLIEKYELPQLQQFNCSRNQLTSLNQLHLFSFPNLTTLILNKYLSSPHSNQIHSLETLYRCAFPNLTELVLFSNRLSSLRGLEKLRAPFLVYLIVDNNDLVNMEGWARGQLHNLTQVQVDKNTIYDFKPLAKTYSPDLIQLRADNSDTAIDVPRLWPTFQRKWTQLD